MNSLRDLISGLCIRAHVFSGNIRFSSVKSIKLVALAGFCIGVISIHTSAATTQGFADNVMSKTESIVALNKRWQKSEGGDKSRVKYQLISDAKKRREQLAELISNDPAAALRVAIPSDKQRGMPSEVQQLLEQEVELSGELEVRYEEYDDGTHKLRRFVNTPHGEHFELKVTGNGKRFKSGSPVTVSGVALMSNDFSDDADGVIAAADENVLTLALGGSSDGGTNGGTPNVPDNTFGEQRTLVILVNFQDKAEQPYTKAQAQDIILNQTSDFFEENSYGQTWLSGDVTGWYTIPVSSTVCNTLDIASHANAAAQNSGYNLTDYTRLVYAFPENACGFWGTATVGQNPSKAWLKGDLELELVAHEMGHNLGLHHSHALNCDGQSIGNNCTSVEYGDSLDVMGWSPSAHFAAFPKEYLGWLNYSGSPDIQTVSQSGTYELDVMASQSVSSRPKALKILKGIDDFTGKQVFYYVEYRQPVGYDSTIGDSWINGNMLNTDNVLNGLIVRTGSPEESSNTSYLLDMTPETYQYYPEDPALTFGRSFHDPESGVTITANWGDGSAASVTVNIGGGQPAPCTRANPTLTLSPSQSQWVAAGTTVNFSVTVTNNDSSSCSNNSFALSAGKPSDWSANFASSTLSIAPGSSATTNLSVTSASSAVDGFYDINISAASGAYSANGAVTYVVDNPTASNNAPNANNDSATINANAAVTIAVLNNDSDPDGDALSVTSTSGVNGSAVINSNNTITFTPASGFSGTEVFNYTISDGRGGTDTASVTVTVNAANSNSAPVAINDNATMASKTAITISVLGNDWDPEGDALSVTAVTQGAKGSVRINSNGTVTYTPAKRFKSTDSFTYTISDGDKIDTATVNLQLQSSDGGDSGGGTKGKGKNR